MTDRPTTTERWNWPHALDAMQAAPEHRRVLLENEQEQVPEAWIAPGDTVPVPTHRWPAVLHVLGASDFVRRDAGGKVPVDSRDGSPPPPASSIVRIEALPPHSLTNVGTRELPVIAMEVKR